MPIYKISLVLILMLATTYVSTAQPRIPIDSVSAYVGKTVRVCDQVVSTFVTKSDKPLTYLNLGADYPNNKLTLVIFQKDLIKFPFTPSDYYKGLNICVIGKIKKYKDKLEIITNSPEQIEIK